MGKMKLGSQKTKLGQGLLKGLNQAVQAERDTKLQEAMDRVLADHSEVFKRLAEIEAQEKPVVPVPTILEQKVVEKTEVVKELSIKTTDRRARNYAKALRGDIERLHNNVQALHHFAEGNAIDIKDLQDLVYKLQSKHDELYEKEHQLEIQISEENQPVKQPSQMLPLILSGLALAASLLSLIIK